MTDRKISYDGFQINWIEKYPNIPWDLQEICRLDNFRIRWVSQYPHLPWDFKVISQHRFLNITWINKFPEAPWDFWQVSKSDLFSMYWLWQFPKKKWNQIYQPIKLQDLSGEIYSLEGWFEKKDILTYARETFPELGEFDLYIDNQKDSEEDYFMASTTDSKILKLHLFQNPNGPEAMIVFLDESR